MIVGCCDSRAAPETVFDAAPGELFVHRNVANLVPPHAPDGAYHGTSAAIEYAVTALGVRHVVVMGHGRCGGVAAFLDRAQPVGDFIGKWISLIAPAEPLVVAAAEAERQQAMEFASVRLSLANLATFPFVQDRLANGSLTLHGAWFDIGSGELKVLDPATGAFNPAMAE